MRIFKYFWMFLKDYKRFLIIPVVFAFVLAIQESSSPYLLKVIIDNIPEAQQNGNWSYIYLIGICYILSIETVNILFRLRDYFKLKVFPPIKNEIVNDMYGKLLNNNYTFHLNQYSGQLASKIADMIKGFETIFNMVVDVLLWRLLSLIFATITMYFAQPMLAGILVLWCSFFIFGTLKLSIKSHCLAVDFSSSRNILFGKISDGLTNILNIILYQKQKFEAESIERFLSNHKIKEEALLKRILKIGLYQGLMVTLFTSIITCSLIYGCQHNLLTLGQFSLVIILSGTIIRNVYSISSDLVQFSKELGTCSLAINVLHSCVDIEPQKKQNLIVSSGKVAFNSVSYSFGRDSPVINNMSLSINANEKIGLVGMSGGGKTTFTNLLLRLFDPQSGSIEIDGQNIRDVSIQSLRENIAVVPQELILFNRSIKENIMFGNDGATYEEMIEAAKKSYCHDFIIKLDFGYDSLVGERGVKLSGGQKQRIALARAFLKNAPIIVLDEPTSALDSVTESLIQKSLNQLLKNKTAIIIAHRLSTLKNLDRIMVFNNGKIHEQGFHDELIKKSGLYQKLWEEQLQFNTALRELPV